MNLPQPVPPSASPDLGIRVIYMVLFGVVFWVLCWILGATTIVGPLLTPGDRISDFCHRARALSVHCVAGRGLKRARQAVVRPLCRATLQRGVLWLRDSRGRNIF